MQDQTTRETRRMMPVEGHPGIVKRGDSYGVRYTFRGKRRWKWFRTLTEAKRFRAKAVAGEARPSTPMTFKAYAPEWAKAYTGRTASGVGDSTRESYTDALTRVAVPFFGTTRLDHVDAPMLRDYIAHVAKLPATKPVRKGAKKPRAQRTMSPATVRRYYAPVRALFATAYEDGLIQSNPALGVRVIVRDDRPAKRKHLTADETARLLAEIPAAHADLVHLLTTTGARISEALTLRYGGIGQDAEGRPVLRFGESKTEAGLRPIPLTPDTARMLTRRRAEVDATDTDLVFPNANGGEFDRRNWTSRYFKPAAERAGVAWASPHKLRHGVATLMAERGYEAHDIARMLRHADGGALAQRTYMHPKVRAVDFLDDVLRADTNADTTRHARG
jgi:integrase